MLLTGGPSSSDYALEDMFLTKEGKEAPRLTCG